jgi:small subunit ribosomal protein S6
MTNPKYETIFVLSTKTYDDAALETVTEKFKNLITENGGEIESVDVWGKRRLAYAINYETEGYYVLVNFSAPAEFPRELERVYGITDGVLRSIVVAKN